MKTYYINIDKLISKSKSSTHIDKDDSEGDSLIVQHDNSFTHYSF